MMKLTRKCIAVLLAVLLGVSAVPGVFAEQPVTGAEQTVQTGDSAQPEETDPADDTEPSPSPETSPTAEPSLEPEPSPSPETSPTAEPSLEPEPSPSPETSPTAEPSLEPEPSPSPETSPTAEPSLEPEPTPEPEKPAALETPVLQSVQNVDGGVEIRWDKVKDAANYRVFYKAANGSWKKAGDTTDARFVWTKAVPNTKYTFTVRCVSDGGKTYESDYDHMGLSIKYMLQTPASITAQSTESGVKISWGKVGGASKYRVFYKTANGGWKKAGDTADASFVWTKAVLNTKYTFTVRCVSKDGKTYESRYDEKGVGIRFVPCSTPKLSSVSNAAGGAALSWGKVSGAQKYRVFYQKPDGGWKKIGDTTDTRYLWKNATSGKHYTFTVRCVSADGKAYTSDYDRDGMQLTYLAQPEITELSATASGVKIRWNKVGGAEKYRVYRKTAGGNWAKIAETSATSCMYDAKIGAKYTYTVRAMLGKVRSSYNADGASLWRFSAPKITGAAVSNSTVTVTWDRVSGAEKYRVFYKTADGSWKKLGDTTSTQYSWRPKDGKKTTYSFTVRCITSDGKRYTSAYDTVGKSQTYQNTQSLVEVDLTKQKLYFYKNGDLLLTSDLVSGCVAWGCATPTGTYRVFGKTRNTYLMNNSFVQYWMPFNGGIGLHDASWRNGVFGGEIYKKNGSHGCINLPTAAAKYIYEHISIGYTVYLHK